MQLFLGGGRKSLHSLGFAQLVTEATKGREPRGAHGTIGSKHLRRLIKVSDQANSMTPYEIRALQGQSSVGMIVRVSHLSVGDPHDGLAPLALG